MTIISIPSINHGSYLGLGITHKESDEIGDLIKGGIAFFNKNKPY